MDIPSPESRHIGADSSEVQAFLEGAARELGYSSVDEFAAKDPALYNMVYRQANGLPIETYENLTENEAG